MNDDLGMSSFQLQDHEVHLWIMDESIHEEAMKYDHVLSDDEKTRASKFRFNRDKNTFITGRVVLRFLLGQYLKVDPVEIVFSYNDQGKPLLPNHLNLTFNLSNSRSAVLIGITKDYPIGVDIEYNKRPIEINEIAPKFFAENEVNQIQKIDKTEQLNAFFNCWTRKEAFIKALGGGLSVPLDQFEVSILEQEAPALKAIHWDENDVANWKLTKLRFGDNYTIAAIVRNPKAIFNTSLFKPDLLASLSSKSMNNAI